MNHIDLFSGIGGFALACKWVWRNDYHGIAHSEVEKFACKVYHKHFPDNECIGDIKEVDWSRFKSIDLITGGFPCQPFSVAGKKQGTKDDRHLWPQMLRAIKEVRPRWVVAENVPGIIRMELDTVLSDLENENYSTGAIVIPACAVQAPHRRDRVWIIASDALGKRCLDGSSDRDRRPILSDEDGNAEEDKSHRQRREYWIGASNENASNATKIRLQGSLQANNEKGSQSYDEFIDGRRREWDGDWYEVATSLCRVDDGVPKVLDRTPRIKALGNAIVPQVAYSILSKIRGVDG